mgnify:CR=1 FL=1
MVGKPHNDLMKDIRRYILQFGEGKIPHTDFLRVQSIQISQIGRNLVILSRKRAANLLPIS